MDEDDYNTTNDDIDGGEASEPPGEGASHDE